MTRSRRTASFFGTTPQAPLLSRRPLRSRQIHTLPARHYCTLITTRRSSYTVQQEHSSLANVCRQPLDVAAASLSPLARIIGDVARRHSNSTMLPLTMMAPASLPMGMRTVDRSQAHNLIGYIWRLYSGECLAHVFESPASVGAP